jgi:hypothetical protein
MVSGTRFSSFIARQLLPPHGAPGFTKSLFKASVPGIYTYAFK